ncbi:ficolin-3-like [Ochlerotatus camptorhynchus]|uniref:ficolin-3-like n=1 Tax=Ochlerotatus camptorhynchus TaxID=644619 RepID=UPI0031D9A31D
MDLSKTTVMIAFYAISLISAVRVTYKSCNEAPNQSGIYWISLTDNGIPFQVYCEQEKYAGHWLVFQSRNDDSTSFNRSWNEYKYGFGNLGNNFWLGLDKLHQLTNSFSYDLMVVMDDYLDFFAFQRYEHFVVNNESSDYSLRLSGVNYGTAGESLFIYNNEKFSTFDRSNNKGTANCAAEMAGGYWHYDCRNVLRTRSNLNGLYDLDHIMRNGSGMWWGEFGGTGKPLKKTRMMIKIRE